ncbi:MAG: CHAT domain-containing protein [Planctomycetes bacterium]|nr:CHAT domain-containing protein [Planctomycetota bacterium]
MNRRCCRALVLCVVVALSFVCAPSSLAAVDESTLLEAVALHKAGKLIEAEKLLASVLVAIDDGTLARRNLGRCVKPLAYIYHKWGRHEEALKLSLRHRGIIEGQSGLDAARRRRELAENAGRLATIYTALGKLDEAETYLQSMLPPQGADTSDNPVAPLNVRIKLAKLAESQQDKAKSQAHWKKVSSDAWAALEGIRKGKIATRHRDGCAAALVSAYLAAGHFKRAIDVEIWLLKFHDSNRNRSLAIRTRRDIGVLYNELRDYRRAKQYLDQALAAEHRRSAGSDVGSDTEAGLLEALAGVLKSLGQRTKANERWLEAAAIYEIHLRREEKIEHHESDQITLLGRILSVYQKAGQFDQAIDAGVRLLALHKQRSGEDHPDTYTAKSRLGALYGARGHYEQGQPLLSEAIESWRAHRPPNPGQLASALNNMAAIERAIGSLTRAEKLFDEALSIRIKRFKPDDLRVADSRSNLASTFLAQGMYDMAVVSYKQAIAIYRSRGKAAEDSLCTALLNVAMVYKSQGQFDQSIRYCNDAREVYQDAFGENTPGSVAYYNAAVSLYIPQGRLKPAERDNRQAIAICEKNHMQGEVVYATALHHQAQIAYLQNKLVDARDHWNKALAIQRTVGQSLHVARSLVYLARVEQLQENPQAAEPLYREALSHQATPNVHYLARTNLADILRRRGETKDAEALLDQAVRLIEIPRSAVTGAEGERAEHFAQFATAHGDQPSAFDLLIDLKLASGQIDEAFQFAERGRNRTFLDQLNLAGIDLRKTLSADVAARLLPREKMLRVKIAALRADAIAEVRRGNNNETDRKRMNATLSVLQSQYADAWKDIRAASPLYRDLRQQGTALTSLAAVRKHLSATRGVMLFYYVGSSGAHLLVVGPDAAKDEDIKLSVPAELAAEMRVDEGPLTRAKTVKLVNAYLADLRDRRGGVRGGVESDGSEAPPTTGLNIPNATVKRGLDGTVFSPKGYLAADSGVELAEVFVPRRVRQIVAKQKARSVVIVPDGALHQLPFEALLLSREPQRTYLLDEFPPISYAPSASILMGLLNRGSSTSPAVSALSVGNPQYELGAEDKLPGSLAGTSRDAYFSLGGQLPALPGTDLECAKVQAALGKDRVTVLRRAEATEANVRAAIAGKRFVHLAAHGLVDQKHDNLFGAIALTVPEGNFDNGENDGFLSLAEIFQLPLGDCELAVLSACQTNVGPDRPLEAASTLAQGFLIAGARRVVCSHWSVDDASTAEMMGLFFDAIADALRRDAGVDYAAALHVARKKIRSDPRWSSPYFWAPFVLLGPSADRAFIAEEKQPPATAPVVGAVSPVTMPPARSKPLPLPAIESSTSRIVEPEPSALEEARGEFGWKLWALCAAAALAVVGLAALGVQFVIRKKRKPRRTHVIRDQT